MKSSRVFGVIVATGLMATTAVMAQDRNAASGASITKSTPETRTLRYGEWVSGPATTDADGIPVAKPNALSRAKDEGVLGGIGVIPGPLTDEANAWPPTNSSAQ